MPTPLGAHISASGGVSLTPGRAAEIAANAMQVFTKNPNRWTDPQIDADEARGFRTEREACGIGPVFSHDSYLINLASPDNSLREKSQQAFVAELRRCALLGIDYVVTHPGNFMDSRVTGISRNAAALGACLSLVPGPAILIETTAGTGTSLGSSFEELAELRESIPEQVRERVGFCVDTCHVYAAGYDLKNDWDGVWTLWEETIGLEHLTCFHVNDSRYPLGARKDRHALIGQGELGEEPFRKLMTDARFERVPKIIETPKMGDAATTDRAMLELLRSFGE